MHTADLSDERGDSLTCADPIFKYYGQKTSFSGTIVTLKIFEDNPLVRKALSNPGKGKVLVVDGGGSTRCALVGDQIASLAIENGWEGIIVYGCIRDSEEISKLPIGIKAINTCPVKSKKHGLGEENIPVTFAGVTFRPGGLVCVDWDGILVGR